MIKIVKLLIASSLMAVFLTVTVGCAQVTESTKLSSLNRVSQEHSRHQLGQANKTVADQRQSLNYEDLVLFEYDCSKRSEQLNLLEQQIKTRNFYKIFGVDGNDFPDRISKKYFSLVKYRIWSLRLGCKGSSVDKATEVRLNNVHHTQAPEVVARCYFEEETMSNSAIGVDGTSGDSVVSRRKEFCTNYPLVGDSKEMKIGDVVDPKLQVSQNLPSIPNLRRWQGNIFQLVSRTEMIQNDPVKFTIVLMWSGKGWVAVDKF